MKRFDWVLTLVALVVLTSGATAQQLRQPRSVQPVSYRSHYLTQNETEASPSDVAADDSSADVMVGNGCDAGCDSCCDSCDTCCDTCCDTAGCAGGCSCACEPWTLQQRENCLGINFGGWLSAGYHSDDNGLFNSHSDKFNVHQMWLYVEKEADGSNCCWDWGFRADVVYGVDAQDTQAFGNPPGSWDFQNGFDHGIYGWALPQVYGEVARGDLSVIFGHFYTLIGYEVVPAPDNFFYSHALTMYNSEPFTHTGVLGTYALNDDVELYGGWTLGWDTGYDQLGDGSNILAGASVSVNDCTSLTYVFTAGDMGDWNQGGRGDGYTHSVVMDLAVTNNLNYVLQSDWVSLNTGGVSHNDEIGINQYLIYTINDCWSYGSRLEWWKSDSGFDYGGQATAPGGSISYYEYTSGLNYKPHANVTLRPEFRYDWSPAANYDESTFGIDAVLTF